MSRIFSSIDEFLQDAAAQSAGPRITLFYTELGKELPPAVFLEHLEVLPESMHDSINRFMFWQDRQRSLYGKLLLREGLTRYGYGPDILSKLTYSAYNRPGLEGPVDFNISHSGDYIICAVTNRGRVGADVEAVREIPLDNFRRVMTEGQWAEIHAHESPQEVFFRYWAMKESVIKANGKGLSIPLDQLEVVDGTVICEGETWELREVELDKEHFTCIASDEQECAVLKWKLNSFL